MKTVLLQTVTVLSIGLTVLSGCATNSSAQVYSGAQAQQAAKVYYGTVLSVSPVTIQGQDNPLITAAGSALGGIGGSHIGGGTGQAVGAIVGAVAAGLATQALTKQVDTQKGVEILVQMEGGNQVLSIVQKDDMALKAGQRVRVITGGCVDRVLPIPETTAAPVLVKP